ncbi:MAG: DolP-mannose mannosyltransferase [Acidobacteriota bacterium]
MNNVAEASDNAALAGAPATSAFWSRRRVFWLCFALTAVLYSQPQYWNWPERRDQANWDYFSQVIARGGAPYKDVVNIKTPASAYIGAAAILVAKPFGWRDIYAIRVTYTLLAALTVALTFMVACQLFDNTRVGVLAAIILAGIQQFAVLNIAGVQPKTPMILFGLVALLATMKGRSFTAGVFGMLSALSWQPGLLFVGAAGLGFSRYLTSWRDLKVARLLAGAAVPLIILLLHLWVAGAVRGFYVWCFQYPFSVYGPREYTTTQGFLDRFSELLEEPYAIDGKYFYFALAGLLLVISREVWGALKGGWRAAKQLAPRHQVIIAAIVYSIFCRIDMQGEQDLIPLLPFVAIFAAALIIFLLDAAAGFGATLEVSARRVWLQKIKFGAACAVLLIVAVAGVISVRVPSKGLSAQLTDSAEIASQLGPGDRIFAHGQSEMLVLSGLTNASKYTNLDHGKDNYLDLVEPGGFAGWFERLKTQRPKIVMLARTANLDRTDVFLAWLASDYQQREAGVFTYYVRNEP